MEDPDPARATAATEAMLRMRKIVVADSRPPPTPPRG